VVAAGVDCERILGTLKLASGNTLPLGPSQSYASTLTATISRLNGLTAGSNAQLSGAGTPASQAKAADALSTAYQQAAASARGAKPGPAEQSTNEALASGLSQVGGAYRAMAAAARSGNRGSYESARASASRGLGAVDSAFKALQTLGYKTGA
jgi:hypothetical protein